MPDAEPANGETLDRCLERAQAAAKIGKFDDAEALCWQVLAAAPGNAAAQALLGMVATNSGHLQKGCRLLEQAVLASPGYAGNFIARLGPAIRSYAA